MSKTNSVLSSELTYRGFINQTTLDDKTTLDNKKFVFYWGVDPSSDSMTIGNLAMAMMVRHFINHGHKAILLVGGATGLIGDPDGKNSERNLLSSEEVAHNKSKIIAQYKTVFTGLDFEVVDNLDWFKDINFIDFLRDIGKHVPMRQMLGREFVQSRLGEDSSGISYAEFSYSLIQGYDFLHLFRTKGVGLQVCGSDQWGNSIAGVELIRRIENKEAHVWSAPLVVNKSTGVKFGKTEGGAIWLDESKTSAYQFYQFWLNVEDENVEDYLKIYTILTEDEIEDIMRRFNKDKGLRLAQKTLADHVTTLVHSKKRAEAVKRSSQVLFGEVDFGDLKNDEIQILKDELTVVSASSDIYETLVVAGLASSKSEARNFHQAGAISINGQKILEGQEASFVSGDNLLKRGKNNFAIVES